MDQNKPDIEVDLCVIGAGAAGLSVASGAVQLGLDVVLIEKAEMGGECLNSGCVPSKALITAAKAAHGFKNAERFVIVRQEDVKTDFSAVHAHIHDVITRIAPHDSQERFEGLGVKVIRAEASFLDPYTIMAGGQTIKARYFVMATGSKPLLPSIDGLNALSDRVLTNESLFDLKELPERLMIVGGGAIGLEMAQAFARLGSRVSVIERSVLLAHDDAELAAMAQAHLEEAGVRFYLGGEVSGVIHSEDGIKLKLDKGDRLEGSHVLFAVGRNPVTQGLGLDKAGVKFDEKAGILVDKRLRTSQRHIYALGDCSGGEGAGPKFTHAAGYQAGIVIRNICFKLPAKADYKALPWVTYISPELAQVGLTEAGAKERYGADAVHITKWALKENDRAVTAGEIGLGDKAGMVKVISTHKGRILGASILAPRAGEMIGLWTLALSKEMKLKDIAGVTMPYPTYGEMSKHVAGAFYKPKLFSDFTRRVVGVVQKFSFLF